MSPATLSLRASHIFPMDGPPIDGGWLTIAGGRILAVGAEPIGTKQDLGHVAILPGLINPHTHLEFSDLTHPLGETGIDFTSWIREVIKWRIGIGEVDEVDIARQRAVRNGIAECLHSGTTTIGEIAKLPNPEAAALYNEMRGVAFWELLGLAPHREEELFAQARDFVSRCKTSAWPFRAGISPHASYTVSVKMVERVADLSRSERFPVAMHLAETMEELELLRSASGPFVKLLRELQAWHPEAVPRNARPLDYLKLLAKADRALIVHGNYLDLEEIEFLGSHRGQMSLIYCPRTHAYFRHAKYPLSQMVSQGANIALGTDSRGSNPDLSILGEVRFVADRHREVPPLELLKMVTINAAQALGMKNEVGSLTPGKRADLTVVALANTSAADPYGAILDPATVVSHVYQAGKVTTDNS